MRKGKRIASRSGLERRRAGRTPRNTFARGGKMLWKDDRSWVYSITYDEGCRALLDNALKLHRRYGIPGHVCLLADQVGVPRNVPGSSYDGMMILSKEELGMLSKEGWGVSCHGKTHVAITEDNAEEEVVEAKGILERKLGTTISIFCVPGSNESYPPALRVAGRAGYKAIMTIYDDVNTPRSDLMRLCRVPIHSEFPPPFYSAFDPYKRIHQAVDRGGWIIDYCHCPMPGKPIHPWKDCTLEQLEERFKAVTSIGGDEVWLAEPNQVIDYLLSR